LEKYFLGFNPQLDDAKLTNASKQRGRSRFCMVEYLPIKFNTKFLLTRSQHEL